MDRRKHIYISALYIGAILFLTVVFFSPNFKDGVYRGADGGYHLARIASLADAISDGVFPAKVRPELMKTYGYGVGFFYPDYLLYFPAMLMWAGICGVDTAYKISLFIMLLFGTISLFYSIKILTSSNNLALTAVGLFLGTRHLWMDVYQRGGVSSMMAFMFLPAAIGGIIMIISEKKCGDIFFAVGLLGTLFTHHLTFFTLLFAIVVFLICNITKVISNQKILWKIIGIGFIDLFISTMYWLPAIEQVLYIKFIAIYGNYLSIKENIADPKVLITDLYSTIFFSLFVISTVIFVALAIKKKAIYREWGYIILAGWILNYLTCSHLIWESKIGEALSFIQYTERFEYVTIIVMVYGTVISCQKCYEFVDHRHIQLTSKLKLIMVPLICILSIFYFFYSFPDFREGNVGDLEKSDMSKQLKEMYNMGAGQEWLPIETYYLACDTPTTAIADDKTGADGVKIDDGKMFDVWLSLDKAYYDMPYVYYYGYQAYLVNDDGSVKALECQKAQDNNGLLRVIMPEESGLGHVIVMYRKTFVQKVSYMISALSVALVIALSTAKSLKKHERNMA